MGNLIKIKKLILLAGDALALLLALPLTLAVRFQEEFSLEIFLAHFYPFLFIDGFVLIAFYILGLYDLRSFRKAALLFPAIFLVNITSGVFGVIFFYVWDNPVITPKINLGVTVFFSAALIWLWRALFQRYLGGLLKMRAAIAGINEHARELAELMAARPYMGYTLSAVISTGPINSKDLWEGKKILFADKNLMENLKREKIDVVITAENPHVNPLLAQAFYECIPHKIRFLDLAQSYELLTGRIPISYISQAWFLENINEHRKILHDKIKRVFDACGAALILIASLPLLPIISFFIKWESKGPIFYQQERVGQNKKIFRLIKFRSMIQDAEQGKPVWAKKKDQRVTRVGAFLRRLHLDELPQMLNIIKGDLSLVGPRPERIEFVRELEGQIPHYNIRHIIRPGFTGWAQVNFRYARTPMDTYEKFQYDLYYLKNRSLILDASILLKTFNLFFRKN